MLRNMAAIGGRPRIIGIVAGRWGPIAVALVLALASMPLVALSLLVPPADWITRELDGRGFALSVWEALLLATSSVVIAAVVGGGVAGLLVRRWPVIASLVAMGIAWPTA